MEQGLNDDDLQRLADAYVAYFERERRGAAAGVDTESFHPVGDDADFARLLRASPPSAGPRETSIAATPTLLGERGRAATLRRSAHHASRAR